MNGDVAGAARASRSGPAVAAAGDDAALAWRVALGALVLLVIAFIALYWRAASGAAQVWYESRAYNHGFLIIPIVLYLVWERRDWLRGLAPAPWPPALLLLIPAGAVWLVADVVDLLEGQQLALFITLQAVLLALFGRCIYGRLRFPFLYLFFLIPTGEFLIPYLQDFTAHFMVVGLRLSGIPVYSDGVFISIPTGNFEVAEACAGLRFLTATIAFGLLFADFAYDSWRKKLAFYALCLVTPVIANGLRAYSTVVIAYLWGNELASGVDHLVYGWVFFSLVTVLLIVIGMSFRDHGAKRPPAAGSGSDRRGSPRAVVTVAALSLMLMDLPRAYAAYLEARPLAASSLVTHLAAAAPWQRAAQPDATWRPETPGADHRTDATFIREGDSVDLFIGYYARQNHERKLISNANHIADPEGWTRAQWGRAAVTIEGERVPAVSAQIVAHGRRRLVLFWYWVDGRFESRAIVVKLLQAKADLLDRRPAAAAVALSTEIGADGLSGAERRLADFAAHLTGLRATLAAAQ
jgi:exosortase A